MLTLCVVLALALVTVGLASCGKTTAVKQSQSNSGQKLPPGISQNAVNQESTASSTPSSTPAEQGSQAQSTTPTQTTAKTPQASTTLGGATFTVVNATRPDTNKSVISSSAREVKGDYLEVEFTIKNVATDYLVDLSEYSFRLHSPGINADSYSGYYGDTGTYGKYVDENEISATLLDYASLSPVAYKVKVGELIDKVFVFFDLNPDNVGKNPNVTKDNSTLVIYKNSGLDAGTELGIPLAGYPD
jgi:hypothetical protein